MVCLWWVNVVQVADDPKWCYHRARYPNGCQNQHSNCLPNRPHQNATANRPIAVLWTANRTYYPANPLPCVFFESNYRKNNIMQGIPEGLSWAPVNKQFLSKRFPLLRVLPFRLNQFATRKLKRWTNRQKNDQNHSKNVPVSLRAVLFTLVPCLRFHCVSIFVQFFLSWFLTI